MAMGNLRIAIITNVIANYREDFYRRLLAHQAVKITIFCQPTIPGMNLNTVHDRFSQHVRLVRSIGFRKEKLGWQFLPFWHLYRDFNVIFIYGNPRILSNVIYSLIFRLLRKRVVICGQAHTAGSNPNLEKIRLAWWRLFKYIFLYTEKEIDYLRKMGFSRQTMVGMNNGLDQEAIESAKSQWSAERLAEWQKEHNIHGKAILLSCARLDPKNRFELMIPALQQLRQSYPDLVWCVIGHGEQHESLRAAVAAAQMDANVLWLGTIYDESQLAPWFLSGRVFVHPGAIGLSLLHAFGYGVPVVTHDDLDNQMPEMAAFKDKVNGMMFSAGDSQSLANTLSKLLESDSTVHALSRAALQTARLEFNTEIMAQRFAQMASFAAMGLNRRTKEIET